MEYYVYQLRVYGEELPFYVGKGRAERAYRHLYEKGVRDGNLHKKRKIAKAQMNCKQILVEFIEENLTEEQSLIREIFWIAHFGRADLKLGPLTNMTNGGEGMSGFIHSEETRKKLAAAASGENSYWYGVGPMSGKTHSEKTKALMSSTRQGDNNAFANKTHTEEARTAMSLAKKGKPQVSDGFAGRTHSDESKQQIGDSCAKMWKITKPDGTVEIVKNLRKYCRDNNLTAPRMIDVANGGSSHHKGHDCERYTVE